METYFFKYFHECKAQAKQARFEHKVGGCKFKVLSLKPREAKQPRIQVQNTKPEEAKQPSAKPKRAKQLSIQAGLA